jgi:hypothetical protein
MNKIDDYVHAIKNADVELYEDIDELFHLIKTYGNAVRETKRDGLAHWQFVKPALKTKDCKLTSDWNPIMYSEEYANFRKRVLQLEELHANGEKNEANHFIIQCLRIPVKEKYSTIKILQIAYNIGQLEKSIDKNNSFMYDEFTSLKLDKFSTYQK